jgi:hypothetical protein
MLKYLIKILRNLPASLLRAAFLPDPLSPPLMVDSLSAAVSMAL